MLSKLSITKSRKARKMSFRNSRIRRTRPGNFLTVLNVIDPPEVDLITKKKPDLRIPQS